MAEDIKKTSNTPELEIVIDDGKRKVPIRNLEGEEIGCFYFMPTDIGILERYNNAANKFDDVVKPLETINISADGTATSDDGVKALQEATQRLYELIDYIFGGNASEAFFAQVNPFSPVAGNFLCVSMINAVGAFIQKQMGKEVRKINKKLGKYTKTVTGSLLGPAA